MCTPIWKLEEGLKDLLTEAAPLCLLFVFVFELEGANVEQRLREQKNLFIELILWKTESGKEQIFSSGLAVFKAIHCEIAWRGKWTWSDSCLTLLSVFIKDAEPRVRAKDDFWLDGSIVKYFVQVARRACCSSQSFLTLPIPFLTLAKQS